MAFYGLESSGCFEAFSRIALVEKILAPDSLAVLSVALIVRNRDYSRARARIAHRICGDDHNRIRSTCQVVPVSCCTQWYLERVATSARTQSNAATRLELA